jgi:hypothetical protein
MTKHVASSITSTTTTAATCRFTRASERLRAAVRILALFVFAFVLAGSLRASQSVSLAWNPVTTSPVAGYAVYMGTNGGVYTSRFDVGTNIDITLTGLKEGHTNFFIVASYDSARTESPASAATSYIVPGLVRLTSPSSPGNPATISFPVAVGHSYQIQASTNFQTWTTIGQTTASTSNAWFSFQDPQSSSFSKRFYRLIMN